MHPTEDDLVLHYYGELRGTEAGALERHLRQCAPCRESFARLERVLHAVDAAPEPAIAHEFERDVWARLRPRLGAIRPSLAVPRPSFFVPRVSLVPRWVLAGGIAALVVLAFVVGLLVAGRTWRAGAPGTESTQAGRMAPADAAETSALRERLLAAAVGDHLDRTELMLIELLNARRAERVDTIDISADQMRAEDLVAVNRLYRQTAEAAGDRRVASMLDELERMLIEVAGGSPVMTAADFDSMRRRIEGQNILFKVQIVSSALRAEERAALARRSQKTS